MATFVVPPHLEALCQAASFDVGSGTFTDVLERVRHHSPKLYARLTNRDGSLARFVRVVINDEMVSTKELPATVIAPGDEVCVLVAISGG